MQGKLTVSIMRVLNGVSISSWKIDELMMMNDKQHLPT